MALPIGTAVIAAPGDITLVSTSGAGVKGNGSSAFPAVSADGTKVAFHSFSANLTLADTDTTPDVYVKDLTTGDVILASTSDTGVKGNDGSEMAAVSADGTKVAFLSYAWNLDPADTTGDPDVYVKDLTTGDLTLATSTSAGVVGNSHSWDPAISADGTKVAFSSSASNFDPADTDDTFDIYVKDLATGGITLASISDSGVKGNENSAQPSLSADGTKVAFFSFATNLDPADTDPFVTDVYVKDLATGDLTLASTSDAGVKGNERSIEPAISADANRVAFSSEATNLDPADAEFRTDIYVKDLTTGDITLASASDDGANVNVDTHDPSISPDGTKVAFHSSNLDPTDNNLAWDVYVKDLATGDITLASTSEGGVNGNHSSNSASITADGTKVAFYSMASNLDLADIDGVPDIYLKELAQAELSVTKTDSPGRVPTGSNLTYTVSVENHGPDGAPGVLVTDSLPPSVTFVSVTPSQGSCTESDGTVVCNLGTVPSGATATVEIVVTPRSAGRITNIVSVSAPASDPVPGNNTDSEDTTVCRITSRRSSIPCG